jgi:hypothetical protein
MYSTVLLLLLIRCSSYYYTVQDRGIISSSTTITRSLVESPSCRTSCLQLVLLLLMHIHRDQTGQTTHDRLTHPLHPPFILATPKPYKHAQSTIISQYCTTKSSRPRVLSSVNHHPSTCHGAHCPALCQPLIVD